MTIKLKKLFSKKKKLLGENHRDFGKNIVLDESGFVKRETFSSLISEVSSFLEISSKYLKEEEMLAFKKFLVFLERNKKQATT
ncbi:hypothetical protein KC842_01915 [Candidatus Nomurabacteria bacterium]|nr:hypothetical protein [Candidatus Nomurabacteria bacterium]